jgi:hypothetical protein
MNLALNSPPNCKIHTLDLPPDIDPKFSLAEGESVWVKKVKSGSRPEKYKKKDPALFKKISQHLGDSGTFDFSEYKNSCSLVFVDASHSYENVLFDSETALQISIQGGIILWHDYGVWEDVTKALDELKFNKGFDLYNIAGTSIVYYKKDHEKKIEG